MKMSRWARVFLLIGGALLAIGVVPLFLVTTFLPGINPVFFALLFYSLAPFGTIIVAFGVILWLIALVRQ